MIDKQLITGLILAGGLGTRMGRVDKGMLPLHGQPLAAHVLRRLAPQVGQAAFNVNSHLKQCTEQYTAFGLPLWPDEQSDHRGPLAGLQSGLRHATTPYVLTVPCDSPLLPFDLAARLGAGLLAQDADVAIAVTEAIDAETGLVVRWRHPVFCLVKTSALPQLDAYLASGGRKMSAWHGALTLAEVLFDDHQAFRNLNTPEELAAVQAEGISVPLVQAMLTDNVAPLAGIEHLALPLALDRLLASDIISPISVPAHDNSAMDGYALRSADLSGDTPVTLRVVDTILAGRPGTVELAPGDCARIMTGAVMPAGCDSVVPQELVQQASEHSITLPPNVIRPGDNRRFKGEDLMAGQPALLQGKLLRPAELGLLASLGIATVPVRRRLRVAFFSTGDELRSIGEPLDAGCIYDSNRYTLLGMLQRLGCEVLDMGIVKDQPQALEAALRDACAQADVVITSGGVSSGAADYTRDILAQLGEVAFWQINMRPGRPMAFGRIASHGHSALLLGLPGNPVAVMATFYFLARPTLLRMMGADAETMQLPLLRVAAHAPIRKKRGRTEYQRGIFEHDVHGRQHVRVTGSQGSGILRSMTQANCIIVLPEEQGHVTAGDLVDIVLFQGLT